MLDKENKKINVVILGSEGDFREDIGEGIQRYVYELYKNLQNYDEINVTKKEYKSLGSGYVLKKSLITLSFGFGVIFDKFKDVNIIHNPTQRPSFRPRFTRKGILIETIHDFNAKLNFKKFGINNKHSFKEALRGFFVMLITRLNMFFVDYIIAVSTQTRDECISLGFPSNKIYVVNSELSPKFGNLKISKNTLKKKGKIKVGYIGSFKKRKNVEFAVRACMNVKGDDFIFEFYGKEDEEYRRLKLLASSDNRIKFMGFAPEEKLINIYSSFDIFLFPSVYEGFGIEPLEAQAVGIPVIIYKRAMIPKEVRKYCFEAESPEHMARIIENIKENGYDNKLRKEAMNYARGFTWDKMVDKIVDVYKDVLKRENIELK
jgi:glycosyltransferase involved in cell wall biosynthesis